MLNLIRIPSNETRFGRLLAWISLYLAIAAGLVVALMMYVIFADVMMRYVFNAPIAGSVEIIYCLMGLLVCLGLGITTYENAHVRVDIVTTALPSRLRAFCDLLSHVLSVFAAGLITWRLSIYALDQMHDLNETQVLALPVWMVAIVMALCSVMLVLNLILHLTRATRAFFRPDTTG